MIRRRQYDWTAELDARWPERLEIEAKVVAAVEPWLLPSQSVRMLELGIGSGRLAGRILPVASERRCRLAYTGVDREQIDRFASGLLADRHDGVGARDRPPVQAGTRTTLEPTTDQPDLVVDTAKQTVEACVEAIIAHVDRQFAIK